MWSIRWQYLCLPISFSSADSLACSSSTSSASCEACAHISYIDVEFHFFATDQRFVVIWTVILFTSYCWRWAMLWSPPPYHHHHSKSFTSSSCSQFDDLITTTKTAKTTCHCNRDDRFMLYMPRYTIHRNRNRWEKPFEELNLSVCFCHPNGLKCRVHEDMLSLLPIRVKTRTIDKKPFFERNLESGNERDND